MSLDIRVGLWVREIAVFVWENRVGFVVIMALASSPWWISKLRDSEVKAWVKWSAGLGALWVVVVMGVAGYFYLTNRGGEEMSFRERIDSDDEPLNARWLLAGAFALVGVVLAVWRARTADRQVKTSQEQVAALQEQAKKTHRHNLEDQFIKALGLLSDKNLLSRRLAGVSSMVNLGEREPKEFAQRCVDALCELNRWMGEGTLPAEGEETKEEKEEKNNKKSVSQEVAETIGNITKQKRPEDVPPLKFNNRYLRNANFSGTHLEGANLAYAHLEGANLAYAHLEDANLEDAHLKDAHFRRAHLERADLRNAHLEDANLEDAHLERADLRNAHLEDADLRNAHLWGANLRNAHLVGDTDFTGADLEDTDFTGTRLEGVLFDAAHLKGARFVNAHLGGASFFRTHNIEDTIFDGAILNEVVFESVSLKGARFEGAHLEGAILIAADLEGTSFDDAHLEGMAFDSWDVGKDDFWKAISKAQLGAGILVIIGDEDGEAKVGEVPVLKEGYEWLQEEAASALFQQAGQTVFFALEPYHYRAFKRKKKSKGNNETTGDDA